MKNQINNDSSLNRDESTGDIKYPIRIMDKIEYLNESIAKLNLFLDNLQGLEPTESESISIFNGNKSFGNLWPRLDGILKIFIHDIDNISNRLSKLINYPIDNEFKDQY